MKHLKFLLLLAPACATSSTATTASDITAAVPKAEWLDIATAAATPVGTEDAPAPAPPATCSGGPPAMLAGMAAQVMGGNNAPVETVLGIVSTVAQQSPSAMSPDHATWGPFSGPGDPVAHQLDIVRVAPDAFHFVLSGKVLADPNGQWIGVFQGDIHSPDPQHNDGDVEIDLGAASALDPASTPGSGLIAIHFAAAPDGRGIDETFSAGAHYVFAQDASGVRFDFQTLADIDHDGTNESADIEARFTPDGSGKASATFSGGSLGSSTVGAQECWDNQQRVMFYADAMNANPPAGDPGCCVM